MDTATEVRYAGVTVGRAALLRDRGPDGAFLVFAEPLPVGTSIVLKLEEGEQAASVTQVIESPDANLAGMRLQFSVATRAERPQAERPQGESPASSPRAEAAASSAASSEAAPPPEAPIGTTVDGAAPDGNPGNPGDAGNPGDPGNHGGHGRRRRRRR